RDGAKRRSAIDLDQVRKSRKVEQFCALVPKGGMLHIHPSGTMNRATVQRLLESGNPRLDFAPMLRNIAKAPRTKLHPPEISWLESLGSGNDYLSLATDERERFL